MTSQLFLIPNSTSGQSEARSCFDLQSHLAHHLPPLQGIFAESLAGGRRWLKSMGLTLPIAVYNNDVPERQVIADLEEAKGLAWAFVSDAGYPCIADPGYRLVQLARERGFQVQLMPGSSAILSAIALSGLPAQRFAFYGYLPRAAEELTAALQQLEAQSAKSAWPGPMLQVFMETPYRHASFLKSCLEQLQPDTQLCIASEVGNQEERIRTQSISKWRKSVEATPESDLVAVYMILAKEKSVEVADKPYIRPGRCRDGPYITNSQKAGEKSWGKKSAPRKNPLSDKASHPKKSGPYK